MNTNFSFNGQCPLFLKVTELEIGSIACFVEAVSGKEIRNNIF